jgi:hypothetical protein
MQSALSTRYADWSPTYARLLLGILALILVWCLGGSLFQRDPLTTVPEGGHDLRLYRAIVERVHAGENYYDAAGRELREGGYPSGSIFNWRTPLYAWLMGALPAPEYGQALLILLAVLTLLLTYGVLQKEDLGFGLAMVGVLALAGPFLWCIDGDAFLAQELWAGVLIALSVCCYAHGRWAPGLAAGLTALFFRELALLYCLLALGLALHAGRRREVLVWLAGFALYAVFLAVHCLEVTRRTLPEDRLPTSWVQFGGPAFLLSTCRMNVFLFVSPRWLAALFLPLVLLGLGGWRGPTGLRLGLVVGAYLAVFAVIGQPFNNYWGLLYVPLLSIGLVRTPAALRDLFVCAGLRAPATALAPVEAVAHR